MSNLEQEETELFTVVLIKSKTLKRKSFFAYIAIPLSKFETIKEVMKKPVFKPADLGVILASGEGKPTEKIRVQMEKEYGFNHENMIVFP